MTTYRVGQAGATVFNEDGTVAHQLRPGQIVVAGSTEEPGSLADQHRRLEARRRSRYEDKVLKAGQQYADKGVG